MNKIYVYGAICKPLENESRILDQMRLMHVYRNNLCRLEHDRRDEWYKLLRSYSSEVIRLEGEVARIEGLLDPLVEDVKKKNKQARKNSITQQQREDIRKYKEELKQTRLLLKTARKEVAENEEFQGKKAEANAQHEAKRKLLRKNSGLFWCNYLTIEDACEDFGKGNPPKFLAWHKLKTQKVCLQIQHGMTAAQAFACTDNRFRLEIVNNFKEPNPKKQAPNPESNRSRRRVKAIAWMRIGSEGKGNRNPVWTRIPVILHRPIPQGAKIKWVYLVTKRLDEGIRWGLHMSLEFADDGKQYGQHCRVSVNPGWRLMSDGTLRVATWQSDSGASGHLTLSKEDTARWGSVRAIQSIRDLAFDALIPHLVEWMGAMKEMPSWLKDLHGIDSLHKWKSKYRLRNLIRLWSQNRIEGDEAIFTTTEGWMKQDIRQGKRAAFIEQRNQRWRLDLYRNFADRLARENETLIIGDINYRDLSEHPDTEEEGVTVAGRNRTISSPGILSRCLKDRFKKKALLKANYKTARCHACRKNCEWDQAREVRHKCEHCGAEWDQDINFCKNLLLDHDDLAKQKAE